MSNHKQRYINTKFWNDSYISELDPVEKLMFIYLLTNEHTNISGVYELPMKIIGIETGIDSSMIKKILPRLDTRIKYVDGFVVIKNFVKHQETGSELVKKGILNCLKDLDQEFLKKLINKGFYILPPYYLDTLSIPYTKGLNYSNSNLDSNSDLDVEKTKEEKYPPSYLKEISKEDLKDLTSLYEVSESQVKLTADKILAYCDSKGRTYKNYKAALRSWIMKDFKKRCESVKL